MTRESAYRECLAIARGHYENFPVASWLVPSHLRGPIAAIYAFARRADDVADEGDQPSEQRKLTLESLRGRLREPHSTDAVDVALSDTIRRYGLPFEVFNRLIDAFVQDVSHSPFTTWEQVLAYCTCSANPIGELLLRLDHAPGIPPPEAIAASDAVCTALQVTNFLQDIATDQRRGRRYLPLDHPEILDLTYELFNDGCRILGHLHSLRLRWEVAMTIAGGVTMLDLCARRPHEQFRPSLGLGHAGHILMRLAEILRGTVAPRKHGTLVHRPNS